MTKRKNLLAFLDKLQSQPGAPAMPV